MGIYDRDYVRDRRGTPDLYRTVTGTAVGTIIALNVICWVLQLLLGDGFTDFMAGTPGGVFRRFKVWQLLTANFVHDPRSVWHLAWNMLFLYFFGRDLERVYGRGNFWTLYLAAGILAVFAELLLHFMRSAHPMFPGAGPTVLGASGAVMAVVVAFTLFYPHRQILLFFMIPMPIWLLCVLYLAGDLVGLANNESAGVANLAHLAGAAAGAAYKLLDLRWERLPGGRPRLPSRRRRAKVLEFPVPGQRREKPDVDEVSTRIEAILAKISAEGQDSLTPQEWEFLRQNSRHYRSPRA